MKINKDDKCIDALYEELSTVRKTFKEHIESENNVLNYTLRAVDDLFKELYDNKNTTVYQITKLNEIGAILNCLIDKNKNILN